METEQFCITFSHQRMALQHSAILCLKAQLKVYSHQLFAVKMIVMF